MLPSKKEVIIICLFQNVAKSFQRCVMLPTVESFDTEATACVPVVAEPKCDKVCTSTIHVRRGKLKT